MPTQSEKVPHPAVRNEEWRACPASPPRSIFGNYPQRDPPGGELGRSGATAQNTTGAIRSHASEPLQTAIDNAMARSFIYRFLAQAYQDPTEAEWNELTGATYWHSLESAVRALGVAAPSLAESLALLGSQLQKNGFQSFLASYLEAFGHAARGRCPLNEIEYGDVKADPLFQPHRLADIAAFFRAFGLKLTEEADERPDHICLELEFMFILAAKEAYALEHQLDCEALTVCRDAQRRFLREHLGRWTPAFARQLGRMSGDTPLCALAGFTRAFIESECARHGIPPGSEDLMLRAIDEAAESPCHSCGLTEGLPGSGSPTSSAV